MILERRLTHDKRAGLYLLQHCLFPFTEQAKEEPAGTKHPAKALDLGDH